MRRKTNKPSRKNPKKSIMWLESHQDYVAEAKSQYQKRLEGIQSKHNVWREIGKDPHASIRRIHHLGQRGETIGAGKKKPVGKLSTRKDLLQRNQEATRRVIPVDAAERDKDRAMRRMERNAHKGIFHKKRKSVGPSYDYLSESLLGYRYRRDSAPIRMRRDRAVSEYRNWHIKPWLDGQGVVKRHVEHRSFKKVLRREPFL